INGADIPGVNASTLNIPSILLNQSGTYTIIASNSFGTITGEVAVVEVGLGFTELFNTGVDDNGNLAPGGTVDLHYQLIYSPDTNGPGPETYILYDDWPAVSGTYMTNGPYSKWIAPTRIDPVIRNGHADGLYVYRTTFYLDVMDPSTAVLRGKWAVDNDGLDIVLNGSGTLISNYNGFGKFTEFTLTEGFVQGTNTLDFCTTNIVTSGLNPTALRVELYGVAKPLADMSPQLVGVPVDITVNEMEDATFTALAIASPPLHYIWYYNGFELTGETNRHLKLHQVSVDQAGSYYVVVSNDFGVVTSDAVTLTVITRPLIEFDPVGMYVERGETAIFEVFASSSVPMTYQWYWNNQPLEGKTDSILQIDNVTPANRGDYYVVVANQAGSVTSAVAVLEVPNTAPQTVTYEVNTFKDTPAIIQISDLLNLIVDADGDTVS
ncbi:MAG TPA: immunoglobulin domain-containing protein, partial [Verrucomicrobiota bacterium]|nr:immunoglobulin domain-containing protein [Verrucomicrobiota bacterium]